MLYFKFHTNIVCVLFINCKCLCFYFSNKKHICFLNAISFKFVVKIHLAINIPQGLHCETLVC